MVFMAVVMPPKCDQGYRLLSFYFTLLGYWFHPQASPQLYMLSRSLSTTFLIQVVKTTKVEGLKGCKMNPLSLRGKGEAPDQSLHPQFAKVRGTPGQETHHPRKIMCAGEAGVLNSFQELIVQTRGAPDIFQPHSGGSGLLGNLCSCPCRFPLDPQGCFPLFSPPNNYSLISFSFRIDFWPDPCVWL